MKGYLKERKRSGNPEAKDKEAKVTFVQGLKLWIQQWRWTNIKTIWRSDYKRVYYNSVHNLNQFNQKLGR